MTVVSGWAYTANEKEESTRRRARYQELVDMGGITISDVSPQYARTSYVGTLDTDEARALSEEDILIFCDRGNTCFGGTVAKTTYGFRADVYTD